jgi:hypothetical protein
MSKKTKGKPSGKYADEKTAPGRKGDFKRSGWPEDAPTQHVADATSQRGARQRSSDGEGSGRSRKGGGG